MYESQGVPRADDMNSGHHMGYSEHSTSSYKGERQWAGSCYKMGSNVTVATNSQVLKVLFEEKRASGLEYVTESGEKIQVSANEEVIVSSGSLGSPKLLLLSGVGPKNELERHGIEQVAELPVGQNYSDHVMLATYWHLPEKRGLSLGDVEMRSPECDWTCGLPVDCKS
jgi:choline dehydrogenase-like flavoprotein